MSGNAPPSATPVPPVTAALRSIGFARRYYALCRPLQADPSRVRQADIVDAFLDQPVDNAAMVPWAGGATEAPGLDNPVSSATDAALSDPVSDS